MKDRMLTNEEKMKLLEKIVLDGNLSEIEKTFLEIKNGNNYVSQNDHISQNNDDASVKELLNDIDDASIYSNEALPYVREDLVNHPITPDKQNIVDVVEPVKENDGRVLKRTLNTSNNIPNLWGESGAKLVTPGENLDY